MLDLDLNEPTETIQTCIPHVRAPETILAAKFIQNHKLHRPLKVLLDSGSTDNHISSAILPPSVVPRLNQNAKPGITLAGIINTEREVDLAESILMEFLPIRRIQQSTCKVFDTPCNYDIILGQNILTQLQIDLKFSTQPDNRMDGPDIPMKPLTYWNDETVALTVLDCMSIITEDDADMGMTTPKVNLLSRRLSMKKLILMKLLIRKSMSRCSNKAPSHCNGCQDDTAS